MALQREQQLQQQRQRQQRQREQDEAEEEERRRDRAAPMLRSLHNRHSSFVRFINTTRYDVSVYWIDYQGKKVAYKELGYHEYLDINTFVTHPWIFVDEQTKDRFLANGKDVYFPQAWFDKYPGHANSELIARIDRTHVYITLPLYSLRDICLRAIKRLLRHDWQAFGLEIPWSLQRELYSMHPRKPD